MDSSAILGEFRLDPMEFYNCRRLFCGIFNDILSDLSVMNLFSR